MTPICIRVCNNVVVVVLHWIARMHAVSGRYTYVNKWMQLYLARRYVRYIDATMIVLISNFFQSVAVVT